MLNPAQAEYISKLRESDSPVEEALLRGVLKDAGWPDFEIEEAISMYQKPAEVPVEVIPPSDNKVIVNETDISAQTSADQELAPKPRSYKKAIIIVVLLNVSFLLVGAYFIFTKFSTSTAGNLTDETILTHLYEKISTIEKASYDATFSIDISQRDEGAIAFADLTPISTEELAKYQRDYDRIRYLQKIKETLDKIRPRYGVTSGSALFPKTLAEVKLNAVDPLGGPYLYTRSADGTSYTIEVMMETTEAYQALRNSAINSFDNPGEVVTDKKITLNENSYISTYGFQGKPTQPKLFGLLALEEVEAIIPDNFFASVSFGGSVDNETDKPTDARLHLAGEVSLGDASFAVDLEGIKKDDKYFGIVNKIPTFFSMFSQLRGKWVGLTENDLRNYGYGEIYDQFIPSSENEREQKMTEARESFKKLLAIASKHKIVSISTKPEEEVLDGEKLIRYSLKLNKDSLAPFLEEAYVVLQEAGDGISLDDIEEAITYLKSEDFDRSFSYLSDNLTFNIWFDEQGYPVKIMQKVRYVPSDSAPALKGKQINTIFTFKLSGINKKLEVKEPEEYMTFDELMVELTGRTLEEVKIENQGNNITAIRRALRDYKEWSGTYPSTIEGLLNKRQDVTKKAETAINVSPGYNYYPGENSYMNERPFINKLPNDVYTSAAYDYSFTGDDYKLTYTINLVPYTSSKDPANYYYDKNGYGSYLIDYNYYSFDSQKDASKILTLKFVDGLNTATKDVLSQVNSDTKDQDKDNLADALEIVLETDPQKADTDKDGFTDYEEITTGSNPTGPGKLDYQRPQGLFF